MERQKYTQEWREYQRGIDYKIKLDYYARVDRNWNFYNGKQWLGVNVNGLPKFTFNICRSAINYFIASILSKKVKMQYTAENIPDEPKTPEQELIKQFTDLMTGFADLKWEKDKMDFKLRQLLLDGANSGDFCAYVYWDATKETGQDEKGDFVTELVDGVNVHFGNPNNPDVEAQPYILIVGREMVSKLKEEAKANGIPKEQYDNIHGDSDTLYQAGSSGKIELDEHGDEGKCLYIIKFWKENGIVYWSKSTKYCPIRKKVSLGISRYPVAWGNWEKVKNSMHGNPPIEGIIDNQIGVNQLFAMVAYWMRMSAFGKVIYDQTRLEKWTNKIGEALAAQGPVSDIVYQLQAGNFNSGVLNVIDMAIKYTKDFIGASDAALGQVKPENTSAIIAVQKAAAVPLENVQANLYQFVEDLALIWGEFILKKYGNRLISYRESGVIKTANVNMEQFRNILLRVKVDVGPSTYWSEITAMQTLDNLLRGGMIDLVQYLERVPSGIISKKQELIDEIKDRINAQQMQGQYEQMAKWLEQQPLDVQEQIINLPPEQQEQVILQMMNQTPEQGVF